MTFQEVLYFTHVFGDATFLKKNTVVTQKTPPIRKRPYGISKRLRWSKNPSQASFHDSKKRRKWWGKIQIGKSPARWGNSDWTSDFFVIPGGRRTIRSPISETIEKFLIQVGLPFSLLLRWVGFTSLVINLPKWQWLVGGFSPTKHWKNMRGTVKLDHFPKDRGENKKLNHHWMIFELWTLKDHRKLHSMKPSETC